MKRLLSGILSLMMVFSLTPTTITFAENVNNTENVTQSEEGNGSSIQGTEQEGTSKIDSSQIVGVNALSEVSGNGDSQDDQSNSSESTEESGTENSDTNLASDDGSETQNSDNANLSDTVKGTITPEINFPYEIKEGGTYNIEGGEYDYYYNFDQINPSSIITISTTEAVTFNIQGDIQLSGSLPLICLNNNANVTINAKKEDGSNYVIETSYAQTIFDADSGSNCTATFNGGNYQGYVYSFGEGFLKFNQCVFSTWAVGIYAKNIEINDCSFDGVASAIDVTSGGNLKLNGDCSFSTIYDDISLLENSTLTFGETFTNKDNKQLKIKMYTELEDNEEFKVTADTSLETMNKISSYDGYVLIKKEDGLYFWNHEHSYGDPELSESKDSLVVKCENSDCNSSIVLATLNAVNTDFTSKSYSGASVTLKEDYEDSITKDDIEYKEKDAADTEYSTTAPTQVGKYTASVTLTYDSKDYTLIKDFEITNTISSPSYNTVTITKGGTYNIEGGNYYVTNREYAIVVNTDEKVILNILGDISCHDNEGEIYQGFINIKGSGEVIVNSNNHTS